VERASLYLAQTPQGFSRELLSRIVDLTVEDTEFTDEAMAAEHLGIHPRIVPGSSLCFKITTPDDFAVADALFEWLTQRRTDHEDWFWLRHTSAG
jgi:2-C-methyl-D-erythritol 4-phosphate cytidylyltransferase